MIQDYRFTKEWPYHISCGGVVYRAQDGKIEVMLLVRHDEGYDLPKGTLHVGETLENCALRETKEESGQETTITAYLGSTLTEGIETGSGFPMSKTVHYFALKWTADTGVHDEEYDHVEWTTPEDAKVKLSSSKIDIVGRFLAFAQLFPTKL